jgi:murein lipoprotein
MKKSLLMISMMLVLTATLMGCATSRELEKVQAQEKVNGAKADQALMDALVAKATAEAAAARADNAVKAAEEREKVADEKAKRAEAAFQQSMRK